MATRTKIKEDKAIDAVASSITNIFYVPAMIWVFTWGLGVRVPSWGVLIGLNTGINVLYISLALALAALSFFLAKD